MNELNNILSNLVTHFCFSLSLKAASVVGAGRATNDVEEEALVARDAKLRARDVVKLVAGLVKQCLEKRVVEKADFDDKPLVVFVFPNVHHQVAFRDVFRDRDLFMVRHNILERPQIPLATILVTTCTRTHFIHVVVVVLLLVVTHLVNAHF